jgi:Spy/CpxP family protein refolding chaperone
VNTFRTGMLLLAFLTPGTINQAEARSKWWLDGRVQRHLQLSSEQVGDIDAIFEGTKKERATLRSRMEEAEGDLARALQAADDERATELASVLAQAQAAHGRARALMVSRIYRVLQPHQRERLPQLTHIIREHAPPQAVR